MTTYNTGNPIGSTDARDRLDNSENMDILENSTTLNAHADRLGIMRKTRKGMELEHDNQIAAHEAEHDAQISTHETEHNNQMQSFENDFDGRLAGVAFTRVGTFTAGATLTDMRQTLLWEVSQGGDGHEYGWAGSFLPSGKAVAAGSTPASTGGVGAGAWVDRTDDTLRSELLANGTPLIGVSSVKKLDTKINEALRSPGDDGQSNIPLSLANILTTDKGLRLPKGTITVSAPIIVDGSRELIGYGSAVSILKPAVGYNGPVVKVINTTDANAMIKTNLRGFSIIGQLDLSCSSQDGILVTADPAKGGLYINRFSLDDVIVTRMGGSGVHLNGCTASTIKDCDIHTNRYFGIHLDNTPLNIGIFNNVIDILFCRIKQNTIGIYGQGYEVRGITSAPSGNYSTEIQANIYGCLFENNLGSYTGNWYDYADGLGGPTRPSIAVLMEGCNSWNVQANWFEAAFQMIKFNGRNKGHNVRGNKFNYQGSYALAVTAYNTNAAVVFDSGIENTLNTIEENFFGFKNELSGGAYNGNHIIINDAISQGNRFVRNICDLPGPVRNVTVTSGTFADKNYFEAIIANDNATMVHRLSRGNVYSAPKIRAEADTLSSQAFYEQKGNSFQRFDMYGYNLGSLVSKRQWNFFRTDLAGATLATHGTIELALRSGDISGTRMIMFGAFTPEGSITANVGSLYMRTDGGTSTTMYVKESGIGNTGWVAK